MHFIPLANGIRGPSFFPHRFMAHESAKRAGHKSTDKKNEDPKFTVRTEKTRFVRYLLYLYCVPGGFENDFYSRGTASNF